MNFKKIVAAVAAGVLTLSTFAFSATAADPTTVTFYAKEDTTWADTPTTIDVTGDGDYSVTLDVSAVKSRTWGYFMADYTQAAPEEYRNAMVTVKSFKVNGDIEIPLAVTTKNWVSTEDLSYQLQLFNIWTQENNMVQADRLKEVGGMYALLDENGTAITVESFTVDFTISNYGGAATTAPATGNTPVMVISAICALAVVGAVVSRKRK
jgi:hypothetical protein